MVKSLLLVHRSPIVRQGACRILEHEMDLQLTCEASSPSEGLEQLERHDLDMIVTGLVFRDASGLRFVSDLATEHKRIPVLVLSHYDEGGVAERVIRAGAQGYCRITVEAEEFVRMIRLVAEGQLAISEAVKDEVLHRLAKKGDVSKEREVDQLSDREMQVFELLGQGHTAPEIGDVLNISSGSVYTYQSRIKTKLGCENTTKLRWQAMRWVERGSGA